LFGQVAAVRSGNALAVLDGFALSVWKAKMPNFLQGQLSGDIREVQRRASVLIPRPKGACWPVFLSGSSRHLLPDGFSDICQAIAKRLTMFVMRSKVKVTVLDGAETSIAGVRGVQVQAVIEQYFAKPAAAVPLPAGTKCRCGHCLARRWFHPQFEGRLGIAA
jgi:hypothetical protein